MKRFFLAAIFLLGAVALSMAQDDMDAFRFSHSDYEGTARFMGAGGAFSAVGAEFSALNVNPAAIGVFKKNEVTFTPMVISIYNNNGLYNGKNSFHNSVRYSLTNAGGVFRINLKKDNGWKAIQLGFGYNRTHDYNNQFRIEGQSNNSSMMDEILAGTQGKNLHNISDNAYFAWKTWMIDCVDTITNKYTSPFAGKSLHQKLVVESSGANDEMAFSIGGNYNDMLFIGATIGVPIISYNEKTKYTETDVNDVSTADNFCITENLRVRTTGVNLKLGIIYQPAEFVRIGAAFHTPSYFGRVRNTYTRTMTSLFDDGMDYSYDHTYNSNYTLTTPLRAIGSVAFLIKKRAFVSAEYEYTGYNMSRMSSSEYSYDEENEAIQDKYGACHTVRIGGEAYLTSNFLLRAGYNFKSSAYRNTVNNNNSMHTATVGLGIRAKGFLFDLAYVFKTKNENYWFYDSDLVDPASLHTNIHRIVATIGYKF